MPINGAGRIAIFVFLGFSANTLVLTQPSHASLKWKSLFAQSESGAQNRAPSSAPARPPMSDDERIRAVFRPLFENDEKKAKVAYGRNHRYLPEDIQFAMDLHFSNFDHALEILPRTIKSQIERDFWEKVVKSRSHDLT